MMFRFSAMAALMLGLMTAPGGAVDLSSMTEDERDTFRAEVRAYLLDNPEVIMEAVQLLEERQARAQMQSDFTLVAENEAELFDDGYSWVGGNPDGDITLVEFMDYRCGFCRRAVPEVARLLAEDGKIRWVIKELPILGEASVASSRFAIATKHIAGPEAYSEVHDALIDMTAEPTEPVLRRLAEGLGLDADAILTAMESGAVTQELNRTKALAQKLQINGTPTFVLQDELLRGFLPAEQMAEMITQKRAR